jgi:hypothetical protein
MSQFFTGWSKLHDWENELAPYYEEQNALELRTPNYLTALLGSRSNSKLGMDDI